MTSIFTKIINRELPAHFVYEDEKTVAILDKFPSVKGQTLVIPKQDVDYAFDMDEDSYLHLLKVAKQVAKALDASLKPERTCLVIEGFEIPHVHIKLYPMPEGSTNLHEAIKPGEEAKDSELEILATQISAGFDADPEEA